MKTAFDIPCSDYYKQLFEHAPIGILQTRLDGTIINANPAMARMLGYGSAAEYIEAAGHFVGNSYAVPQSRQAFVETILSQDQPYMFENRFRRKDGTALPCRVHVRAARRPDGGIDYLDSFVQDMSQEIDIARTLEKREAQYRSVFENTGAGTIIIEQDTTISMANAGFAQMLGFTKEQIEGKMTWTSVIADDEDRERMLRYHHMRRHHPEQVPVEYEFKLRNNFGNIKNIWLRVDMITGTDRSVASLVDITSLKQAERNLRSSESKLSGILEAFGGFAYACSRDRRLTFANKTLRAVIGNECLGILCHEAIFRLDAPCPWCGQEDVFRGETVHREFVNPIDGRWYFAVGSPIFGANDAVAERQTVIVDIHKRKQAELDLKEKEARLQQENIRLRAAIKERYRFGDIVGKSAAMQKVYELILRAAATDANVIIYGESGTGKELVARAIHDLSERGGRRFVPVNCGAIPPHLMESEFFGYKKGAFTGADQTKPGLFDYADDGTLFLDELGEIKEEMQVKLLRVLEGGGYTPIGGLEAQKSRARIISATNKELVQLLEKGRMREDFFYRIHIFPIQMPPLRERREDIPLLVDHFLAKYGKEQGVNTMRGHELETLINYGWPGNVRQLENTIQRYLSINSLDFMDFQGQSGSGGTENVPVTVRPGEGPLRDAVQEFERAYLFSLLNRHQWNRTRVASILGIERKTLYLKLRKLGIQNE